MCGVGGELGQGQPWSGQKIGAFLCRDLRNDNWCGINHTTPHFAPGRGEQLNSFPTLMEQHVFCPANFLTEAVVVSVAQLPPRPRILPCNNSPGAGWAGLGWAGHRKTTKCQSRSRGRMDGWNGGLGWYWCSEGWETLDRSWRRLVVDGG